MNPLDSWLKKSVILGLLAVIVLWIVALGPALILASNASEDWLTKLGLSGDLFATSAAFFAGLGFLGVGIVLVFDIRERQRDLQHRQDDLRERKRSRRPYVWPSIDTNGVIVDEAIWHDDTLDIRILTEFSLKNATAEPALNVTIECDLVTNGMMIDGSGESVEMPLGSDAAVEASVRHLVSGGDAMELLRTLESAEQPTLKLRIKYTSLNASRWQSSVEYTVGCNRATDRDLLRRLADKTSGERIGGGGEQLGGGGRLYLEVRAVRDTWRQRPLGS